MVALVVTIVVLLILSTITIQGITHTGLFSSAEKAKLDHKRAYIATTLETKLKISQSEQIRGTDEEIIKATYEDVKNDLDEIKKAGGKDIEVGEVTSEEREGKTEWFFEVKVDGDVYKVALDGSDYLGKENELSPLIQIKTVKSTTNTISVSVTTKRNEGGKVEYYIKEKAASKFTLAKTTDQNEYTYTGLKQDTTFVIKAIAIGKNGKEKESKEVEIETSTVPKFDSKEIEFAVEPNTWTNKSVKVTAKPKVDTQGFTLVTSKNPTSSWTKVNNQTFSTNGTMYVALTDGNNYGVTASHEVTNIDKIKPVITSVTATTNTIKITATDEASGICAYAISESSTMPTKFTVVDSTKIFNKIIENKKQSTKYYVWVKDQAGNVSEVASTTTGTVAGLTDANTTFSKTPNDWTNKDVTVTAATTEKNFALQTKKDNGEWQTTGTQTFTENGTIYARLWDGINAGAETKLNVTNIDKLVPNAFTPKATVTTNSIKVDGTTTDAQATSTNGSSGIKEYRFSKDGGKTYTNAQTSATYTFGGLTQNVEYTIVVEAKDNAGNTTTGTVKATTGKLEGITFTYSTKEWTKNDVTVTASTSVAGATIQTSKDNKTWSTISSQTFTSNGTMYAKLSDGTNISEVKLASITNIDKTAPILSTITNSTNGNWTNDKVVLGWTITENDSGIEKVEFSPNGTTWSGTLNSTEWYGLTRTNERNDKLYFRVTDKAGNVSNVQETTLKIDKTAPVLSTITNSTNGNWTNDKVVLSWTITENGSGIEKVEYSSNGTTWSGNLNSTEWYGLTRTNARNDKLYFRVTDKAGNVSNVNGTTLKIDKTAPTINSLTSANWTNSTNGVVLTGKATDAASGISYYQFSTSSSLTASSGGWTAITNTTSQLTQTYSAKSDNTTYYFYVKDAANNVTKTSVVAKLDKVAPTISTDLSGTTDKIATNLNLSMGVTDSVSGLSKITWYYKKSTDTTYSSVTDTYTTMNGATAGTKTAVTKTKQLIGLTANTTYNIYAIAYDVAGNKKQSSTKTVKTPIAVAGIGTTQYAKLEYAVAAVTSTDVTTIKMLSNTSEKISIGSNQNIVLSLNGKEITTHTRLFGKLTVEGDGKMTAMDDDTQVISSVGTLEIKGGTITGNDKGSTLSVGNNSTTIISGGKIISKLGTIDVPICAIKAYNQNEDINKNPAKVTITGGEITSSGSYTIQNNYSYMTITGGTISNTGTGITHSVENNCGNLEIKGGTITGNNEGSKVFVNSGSTTVISGGIIINEANLSGDAVCAVKAYNQNEDVNVNPAKLTITGGTIISKSTSMAIQNAYSYTTITGGNIGNSGGGMTIQNKIGNLKINMSSGTISSNSTSYPTIQNTQSGVFTFTKGTITNTANYYCYYDNNTKTGVKGGTWKK